MVKNIYEGYQPASLSEDGHTEEDVRKIARRLLNIEDIDTIDELNDAIEDEIGEQSVEAYSDAIVDAFEKFNMNEGLSARAAEMYEGFIPHTITKN